jgi:hypothetical protein
MREQLEKQYTEYTGEVQMPFVIFMKLRGVNCAN